MLFALLFVSSTTVDIDRDQTLRLREQFVDGARAQGIALLTFGAASIAAGGSLALSGAWGERGLSLGLNTLAWGAVNTALGLLFYLQGDAEKKQLVRDAELPDPDYYRRQLAIDSAYRTQATIFAVNTGLDVLYIAGGTAAWLIADRFMSGNPTLAGVGIAALMQGAFLFVFDLASWLLANHRADALAKLRVAF